MIRTFDLHTFYDEGDGDGGGDGMLTTTTITTTTTTTTTTTIIHYTITFFMAFTFLIQSHIIFPKNT